MVRDVIKWVEVGESVEDARGARGVRI